MSELVTLKENRDFHRLYKKGKCFVSPVLVTYVLKNRNDNLRYGITTGKKIGNAVKRSRSRRIIRAAFSSLYPSLNKGYDIVFVARGKTPYVKSDNIKEAMENHFAKAGLFAKKNDEEIFN
jgi:ribonuclease P protein component